MKHFILIALLFLFGCSDGNKDQASYDSLSSAIIKGLLTKDSRNHPVFIHTSIDQTHIDDVLKFSPEFIKLVKNEFNLPDTISVRKLLGKSAFLDTSEKAASNVRYVNHVLTARDSLEIREQSLTGASIIDFLIMLTTKDGNKCLVYFHKLKQGAERALLEKDKGKWKITSLEREFWE
ncbi:hypothetical protein GWC95_06950 [Sediminibacterium roseum]|uniref:SnoaL-like domain-containing protein n=1 Tax=Sediminibacterium roseum TaxID=1978412 RepID=A0ABW9ZRB9_9BACT|nr:hypothetical protein [Sediminibacterium roseum]NCI49652.1 hypothetical protein [Sediminibacterium roseum]